MATLPLSGKRVLITRAPHQAGTLIDLLEAQGAEPVAFPVIATADPLDWAPVDGALAELHQYRWLVVTSPNGAQQFMGRAQHLGKSVNHLKVVAVGTSTAKVLAKLGVPVDLVPGEFRGASIPDAMAPLLQPGDRVLMPRADIADERLPHRLREIGAIVTDVTVYRTVPDLTADVDALKAELAGDRIDYVTFTSGSTVRHLLARLGGTAPLAGARIACIGPETARVVEAAGLPVHVIASPATAEGLVASIIQDAASEGR